MSMSVVCALLCIMASTISAAVTPIHHRIAYNPTGMTVSWSTVGEIKVVASVHWGVEPNDLVNISYGETLHYDPAITWFHHVQLTNLLPSTTYYWLPHCPAKDECDIKNFTTAPPVGSDEPFTVAINGDFGLIHSADTLERMEEMNNDFDFFWHVGDIAYANDWQFQPQLNGTTYEEDMEKWISHMSKHHVLDKPWMLLPGNHEANCANDAHPEMCPASQRNFTAYRQRWRMPYEYSGSSSNMWYSFDYGLVHFINFNTETDFDGSPEGLGSIMNAGPFSGPAGTQLEWLRQDLNRAQNNRANVPWIVAGGHRPYYSGHTDVGVLVPARAAFEPLFNEFGVDVVCFGHIHWTERMFPIAPNMTVVQRDYNNPKNPIYIISASVGNVEGLSKATNVTNNITMFLDGDHYGLGWMTFMNRTHARWQWAHSETGKIADEAYIYKEHNYEREQVANQ